MTKFPRGLLQDQSEGTHMEGKRGEKGKISMSLQWKTIRARRLEINIHGQNLKKGRILWET